MTQLIVKTIRFLFNDGGNRSIALAAVLGMQLGLIPTATIQWFLTAFIFLTFRMNVLSMLASATFFFSLSIVLYPAFNSLGFRFLTGIPELYPILGWMHHAPIVPFTRFNNTAVLGATITAYTLTVPLFFVFLWGIKRYRESLESFWYSTKLSRIYGQYRRIY